MASKVELTLIAGLVAIAGGSGYTALVIVPEAHMQDVSDRLSGGPKAVLNTTESRSVLKYLFSKECTQVDLTRYYYHDTFITPFTCADGINVNMFTMRGDTVNNPRKAFGLSVNNVDGSSNGAGYTFLYNATNIDSRRDSSSGQILGINTGSGYKDIAVRTAFTIQ